MTVHDTEGRPIERKVVDEFGVESTYVIANPLNQAEIKEQQRKERLEAKTKEEQEKRENRQREQERKQAAKTLEKQLSLDAKLASQEAQERAKEEKRLQQLWRRFDNDQSGSLDMNEICQVMNALGHTDLSKEQLQAAMAEMDTDVSGEVSFAEFEAWWADQNATRQKLLAEWLDQQHAVEKAASKWKQEKKKLQKVWHKVDSDGSGTLDEAELKLVFKKMGKPYLDATFEEMDTDGNGNVDMTEFVRWWQHQDLEARKLLVETELPTRDSLRSSAASSGSQVSEQEVVDEEEGTGAKATSTRGAGAAAFALNLPETKGLNSQHAVDTEKPTAPPRPAAVAQRRWAVSCLTPLAE